MKKLILIVFLIILPCLLSAQVFNTAQVLKNQKLSATAGPVFHDGGLSLFANGGYGLKNGMDFGVTVGVGQTSYLGVDIEKSLTGLDNLYLSATGGLHYGSGFGIDGTINMTIPLDHAFDLYFGLDLDVQLTGGKTTAPMYLFVGTEWDFRKNLTILGEIDAGVHDAGSRLGISLCYYFNSITIN